MRGRLECLNGLKASDDSPDPVLAGRITELEYALAHPGDRRVLGRQFIERFRFPITGSTGSVTPGAQEQLGGTLDLENAWPVAFWIGGWDPDLLCAYVEGSLQIPYLAAPGPAAQ